MLNVTALLGRPSATDGLRHSDESASPLPGPSAARWWSGTAPGGATSPAGTATPTPPRGATPRCPTEEAVALLDDIAAFGSPALLLSGGEPFMRPDLLDVMSEALRRGLPVTLSTNGTLVTRARARAVAAASVRYVGISIDGREAEHDAFRRRRGAYRRSLAGIRALRPEGVRVGGGSPSRRPRSPSLPDIFSIVEREGIERVCFHHLVPAGRGASRQAVALAACAAPSRAHLRVGGGPGGRATRPVEVLTVNNYADGPALYLRELGRDPACAERIRERLSWNGGARNASGTGWRRSTGRGG